MRGRGVVAMVVLAITARTSAAQRAVPPAMVTDPAPGIDVLDYAIDISVAPPALTFSATATITLVRTAHVDTLRLDFVKLTATDVRVGGGAVRATNDGTTLAVPLPAGSGDTLTITVTYRGAPADGLIIRRDAGGAWTAFADNWPNRARQWFPSVDHPADKATVSFTVRAPAGYTVVANGTLEFHTDVTAAPGAGATEIWKFRQRQPVPTYLMVVGVAKLREVSLGETACGFGAVAQCVPQRVFVEPSVVPSMPGAFARAGEMVSFFARLFGTFPYEKLDHVQSATRFGGMENAGAIFYAWDTFERPPGMGEGTIAHETAHQWFGDAVTERAWAHLWLSEGFATYLDVMWTERAHGDSAMRADLARIKGQIMAAPVVSERPVIDTAQADLYKLLNANSYQKGGYVLHMLRREVGHAVFVRALREYQRMYRHGNALTGDLRAAFEREHGQPLTWFFDQWLTRPGWADLDVSWRQRDGTIMLHVVQRGTFGAYRLSLPVEIEMADGARTLQVVVVPATVEADVELPRKVAGAPKALRFDPDGDLLATIAARAASQP